MIAVWCVAGISWAALFVFYFTNPTTRIWALAVGAVALLTEGAFWATAGKLGLTLLESRRKVLGWLDQAIQGKE